MGKYKISGAETNREDAKKETKKDIWTSGFNKLQWYHNGNRNITSWAKDATCYNDALSQHENSDDKRKVKQVVEEQEQNQYKNTFYKRNTFE